MKNALANFKAFYQNIRGLKSKVDSIVTINQYLYAYLKHTYKKKKK